MLASGLEMDASTVLWWLQQSDAARAAFRNNDKAGGLGDALDAFSAWFMTYGGGEIWGNGAAFDNTIMSAAYRLTGREQPWKFWNDRCYRTVKAAHPHVPLARSGTHHNAVDDAQSQAEHLIAMLWPADASLRQQISDLRAGLPYIDSAVSRAAEEQRIRELEAKLRS